LLNIDHSGLNGTTACEGSTILRYEYAAVLLYTYKYYLECNIVYPQLNLITPFFQPAHQGTALFVSLPIQSLIMHSVPLLLSEPTTSYDNLYPARLFFDCLALKKRALKSPKRRKLVTKKTQLNIPKSSSFRFII
jgi:hypothetical protein